MKPSKLIFTFFTTLFLLSGCYSTHPPLDTLTSTTPKQSVETPRSSPTSTTSSTSTGSLADTEGSDEEVNHCLDCHSNKQNLIDTAKPEEEVTGENSGLG